MINKYKKNQYHDYHLLCDQAADGMFSLNTQGIIVYTNKSAEKIIGIRPGQALGKKFSNFVDKESLNIARKSLRRIRQGAQEVRDELYVVNKKRKKIPIEFSASPIRKNRKVIYIHIVFHDISRKKHLDQFMLETEKIKALQVFITGTNHEIQNPLRGVLSHSQALIDRYQQRNFEYVGYKEFKSIFQTMEVMRDQIKYCVDTLERLNRLNKKKLGIKNNFCNLNAVVRESIKMIEHQLQVANIYVKLRLSSHLPFAAIGSMELNQVMINILTNAIQAVHAHGYIRITSKLLRRKKIIQLECHDNGVGIPKEYLRQVFDPFFTTKNRGLEKSSGLGLPIAQSVLALFQGQIKVNSSLSSGTTVIINLPIYKKSSKA